MWVLHPFDTMTARQDIVLWCCRCYLDAQATGWPAPKHRNTGSVCGRGRYAPGLGWPLASDEGDGSVGPVRAGPCSTADLHYRAGAGARTFEGMQPTLRQVPPSEPRPSTQATFMPICPALMAAT